MDDTSLQVHLLRAVNVALTATFLAVAVLIVYPSLDHNVVTNAPLYGATLATALVGAAAIGALPWARIVREPWRFRALTAWSALDIVLVTLVVAATGGARSPVFVVYVLTTVFFAATYPGGAQFLLLAFTYGCYLLVAIPTAEGNFADIALRGATLAITTYMVNFLSRRLMDEMTAHDDARAQARRRADLIATVATAGRRLNTLDEDEVLEVVRDAALELGFDAVDVCILDPTGRYYDVRAGANLPETYASARHPADSGLMRTVLATGTTVVVDDYASVESAPDDLRRGGFRTAIATPIRVDNDIVGSLGAGLRRHEHVTPEDVEAFTLLATQAGRALENARRFAQERETVERLEHLDALKSDFLSNMSHELRTPLTVIRGMSATLRSRWDDAPEDRRRDFVARIDDHAAVLESVLTSLLDLSLLQAGTLRLEPVDFDVSDLVARTVQVSRALLGAHAMRLDLDPDAIVFADPALVGRIIENLLSNAAKYTPAGTVIDVTTRRIDDEIEVSVSDNGPGVPPDELLHLGDRFYRGGHPDQRPTRGVGLGLALSRQILELHDSELRVWSQAGVGASFSFRLAASSRGRSHPSPGRLAR